MKLRLLSALLLSTAALTLTGCISSTSTAPMAANHIYLDANILSSSSIIPEIADFDANGCCSPNIFSDSSGNVGITAVATDSSGQVYAALFDFIAGTTEIDVFASGATSASGTVTPTRTFHSGFMTAPIHQLTVDPSGNLYVYDFNGNLFKFTPNANGIAQPLFILSNIFADAGMTTDSQGNFYIAAVGAGPAASCLPACPGFNGDAIYVYSAGFNNTTPQKIIVPAVAEYIDGIAVDASGNIYVSGELVSGTGAACIETYAPTATGNSIPTSVITGSHTLLAGTPTTLGNDYNTLTIDAVGTLYVRSIPDLNSGALSTINEFPSTASGNIAPAVTIAAGLPANFYNLGIATAYTPPAAHH